jgi:mRNA-degrading endonuclease toxin of MazEF toxin-antitoxin module
MKRGDVVLVRFPHPSGSRGKKRPAVIVQSDAYSGVVSTCVVAEVTKNLTMAGDPACLFIDTSTPEGRATGLVRDSVASCLVLRDSDEAVERLQTSRALDSTAILGRIERVLSESPDVVSESRIRRRRGPAPAPYRLAVGEFRVFDDAAGERILIIQVLGTQDSIDDLGLSS